MAERSSRKWWIWGAAVVVYLAAVFHRGSLGVAGPDALTRFGVGPAAVCVLTVLQVGVDAGVQVPTGLLVDRFGSRRVLTAAAILLGLGQLLFAVATSYPLGLLARAVLGFGDALTWVSVLRLVALSFTSRQYTVITTVSSALGGIGGVAATFPLAAMLRGLGWTPTFLIAGGVTLGYAAVAYCTVREIPQRSRRAAPAGANRPAGVPATGVRATGSRSAGVREVLRRVRTAWAIPGTRLAFWVHFCTMFVPAALSLLWGYPYLVDGVGVAPGTAGAVLSVLIFGQVLGGPMFGSVIGKYPAWRMPIVLGYLSLNGLAWLTLLGWPGGRPPLAVIIVSFVVFALGGPVSATAFALVRDYNPISQVGTAIGVANTAGHSASAIGVLAIGLALGATSSLPPVTGYRIAFSALVVMLVLGAGRVVVWWRRARAAVFEAEARGDVVPVQLTRRGWDLPVTADAC